MPTVWSPVFFAHNHGLKCRSEGWIFRTGFKAVVGSSLAAARKNYEGEQRHLITQDAEVLAGCASILAGRRR